MELTILGCDGAYPSANGACSGYLITQGAESLLMDCGTGVLPKLMALMDPARLSAIALTHWHHDHASDLLTLRYYLEIIGHRLPLYAPADAHPLADLLSDKAFDRRDVAPGFSAGNLSITALPVKHSVPAYALRVQAEGRALVYTGDISELGALPAFCKGADMLICDAAFTAAQWHPEQPHISAQMAARLALKAPVDKLVLSHRPPYNDAQQLLDEARPIFANTVSAFSGLRLHV